MLMNTLGDGSNCESLFLTDGRISTVLGKKAHERKREQITHHIVLLRMRRLYSQKPEWRTQRRASVLHDLELGP